MTYYHWIMDLLDLHYESCRPMIFNDVTMELQKAVNEELEWNFLYWASMQ